MSTTADITGLLVAWLGRQVGDEPMSWLDGQRERVAAGESERAYFTAFSGAIRRFPKADLTLSAGDLASARAARPGWDPSDWTCDQAARTTLTLALPSADAEAWRSTLDKVYETADVGEGVALYRALPLLPHPERLRARAAEGIRTNIRAVFESVAHRNPYPSEQLDEGAWNQMVLKALFVGSPLHPIVGIDARSNLALTRMLVDYAHERWAASRDVSPELWRCVGASPDDAGMGDLARALAGEDPREAAGAGLALAACPHPDAADLLAGHPALVARVESGQLTWEKVHE